MVRFRRAVALLTLVASFSAAAVSAQNSDAESSGERDHPTAREQWFRHGRTIRGEAAAGRLYEGYRQKMRMRVQQRAHRAQISPPDAATTATSAAPSDAAAASVSTSVIQCTPLGPAPINDSA